MKWLNLIASAALLAAIGERLAVAEEVEVKNDSLTNFGSGYVVGDFVPTEHAGVVLQAPCDGSIVAIRILWMSAVGGGAVPTVENGIHIYQWVNGAFPVPGPELQLLEGPVLQPGGMNEFRYIDENQSIPLNVPVTGGQKFYVTLEFGEPTDVGNGSASVVRDIGGCQSQKNVLREFTFGWLDFCTFISGDLVIRAVINCSEPSGACCYTNGTCANDQPQADCLANAGAIWTQGATCAQVSCVARGACCYLNGICAEMQSQAQCLANAGAVWTQGATCAQAACAPRGACCLPDGTCALQTQPQCTAVFGGVWTASATCAQISCSARGACCRVSGCLQLVTQAQCQQVAGVYAGNGSNCNDNVCAKGACCQPNGTCSLTFDFQCALAGGIWHGANSVCDPNPCPQPVGACCFGDFCISDQLQTDCASSGGEWAGPLSSCLPNPCAPALCPGDLNCDGVVDFADIDPFVQALSGQANWPYPNCPWLNGDTNGDQNVDFADIDPFVARIGAACN